MAPKPPTHLLHARFSGVSWWLSEAGLGVRCAIIVGVIVLLLCLLWLSRWHAERRVRKGLKPLWYHRWLAPKPDPPPGAPRAPRYGEPGYVAYMHGEGASVWRRQGDDGNENTGTTELAGLPPYSMDVPPAYKPVVKASAEGEVRRDGVVVRTIEEDDARAGERQGEHEESAGAVAGANVHADASAIGSGDAPTSHVNAPESATRL